MNFGQSIKLAAKSLWARKGRTFLSMLGIIIGLAAVITLVSYSNGQMKAIMAIYESMGTNQLQVMAYKWTGGGEEDTTMFDSIYNYCQQQLSDYVDGVTPTMNFWGMVSYGTVSSDSFDYSDYDHYAPQIYMGSDQWSACNNAKIAKGRDMNYLDVKESSQVCVLGYRAAKAFFNYADPIGKTMTFDGVPFTVIGVYAPRIDESKLDQETEYYKTQDSFILLPYTAARALRVAGSYGVDNWSNQFVVKCKDSASTKISMARLESFLKTLVGDSKTGSAYGGYSIYSQDTFIDSQASAGREQAVLLGTIAAISLLVSGIGIMNIMLVTVTERTREIGIRKAIGAERKSIIVQFLIEACMICGLGGILGILASYPATWIYCKIQLGYLVQPDTSIMGIAAAVSVLLGIVFGLYPAVKASGLQPVEALRAE